MQRRPRRHDEKHLAGIRQLPCLLCEDDTTTEAAHIRFSCLEMGKRHSGIAEKPDDCWTVPLCGKHHRLAHDYGKEREWWRHLGKDPLRVAAALALAPDHETRLQIVLANR